MRARLSRSLWFLLIGSAVAADEKPNQTWPPSPADKVVNIRGVHPHLTVYNPYGECGIGAVVPWAGQLWIITYPPHFPQGSADGLYRIDPDLKMELCPESIGGTHANRMIHEESNQLVIGGYFIDAEGRVRATDPKVLRARLTATTRHLADPANKVLFVGMERELYEVDVKTLATTKIHGDMQGPFPGYHGKGAIAAQGQLIVANNGEKNWDLKKDPGFNGPAGCLAESDGEDWSRPFTVVARTNFCEVTGPGGIKGFAPGDDRVWATGWDKRSVLLKLREQGQWHTFRLPKASYSHDALHGWYTEWPRIREVTDGKWLMHMHGLFYEFPKTFAAKSTGGLRPISTHLKMPVDYCAWNGQIVMGCDDASVMQNPLAGQSHSNLRFLRWSDLQKHGASTGAGGVWLDDTVQAGVPSDPFLMSGFTRGVLHIRHEGSELLTIAIEADASGVGEWKKVGELKVPAKGYRHHILSGELWNAWLRLAADRESSGVTAYFHLGNAPRGAESAAFQSLAAADRAVAVIDGVIKPADGDARTLLMAANSPQASGFFRMDGSLELAREENAAREKTLRGKYGVSKPDFSVDAASVIVTENGQRFRLPKTEPAYDTAFGSGWPRGKREVVTERDLFNAHGTFYEVPRVSAGGFRRMRPVCTHGKRISDFASWRGLLVIAGVEAGPKEDPRIIRSRDGGAALWLGEVDDLWSMGAPRGSGGPWKDAAVKASEPSDPYLMAGYDRKTLELTHDRPHAVAIRVEVDFLADGSWSEYARFEVEPGKPFRHEFPAGYSANWVRLTSEQSGKVTGWFVYGAQPSSARR